MENNVVEIYRQKEVENLIVDNESLDEWTKMAEELGLVGQLKLQSEPTKSPIPYLHVNNQLREVIKCLCPTEVEIDKFSISPIPLDILREALLSKHEGYFTKIYVHYDNESPDPFLVGHLKEVNYKAEWYLIGRWGDVKKSLQQLYKEAYERMINDKKIHLEEKIMHAQENLKNLNSLVTKHLKGEWVNW